MRRIEQYVIQTAEEVQQNLEEHAGNYVDSDLHWQKGLRFFIDNTDGQVDKPEDKNLFYATAMALYQR